MSLRRTILMGFAVALSLGPTGASLAAKRSPEVEPIPDAAAPRRAGPERSLSVPCSLGEMTALYSVNYIQPPDDAYYTLLHVPSFNCRFCPGVVGGYVSTVHVILDGQAVCNLPLTVAIYGVTGDSTCRAPDLQNPIVLPFAQTLTPLYWGMVDYAIPLPHTIEILGDAFLSVKFTDFAPACSSWTDRPRLVTSGSCTACESYNFYPGGNDQLCAVGFPGNPAMYVTVDSCITATAGVVAGDGRAGLPLLALESNPVRARALRVTCSLPSDRPARLEMFDLLGHRVATRELPPGGDGPRTVALDETATLRPGLYLVRVSQGGRSVAVKATLLR